MVKAPVRRSLEGLLARLERRGPEHACFAGTASVRVMHVVLVTGYRTLVFPQEVRIWLIRLIATTSRKSNGIRPAFVMPDLELHDQLALPLAAAVERPRRTDGPRRKSTALLNPKMANRKLPQAPSAFPVHRP